MEGEGPTQYSPWFRLTAQEPGWEVDETALYLQGVALFLLCAGLVVLMRTEEDYLKDYDNTSHLNESTQSAEEYSNPQQVVEEQIATTPEVQQTPPLPATGLPEGWTMDQWVAYGHLWYEQNT